MEPMRGVVVPKQQEMQRAGREHRAGSRDPFRCAYCASTFHLLSFTAVYGNGSSTSRYRKGLILKTGWAETKKQTLMAEKCSPPRPRSWLGYALAAAGTTAVWAKGSALDIRPELIAYAFWFALAAALACGYAIWWNAAQFPKKMATWSDSFFCKRCGKVSIISTNPSKA